MKRFFIFVIILCFIAFLARCHPDEKQAAAIQEKMEVSASYEAAFASNQEDLNKYREKEQSNYNDLLDLDIQDEDIIQQRLEDAATYIEKQKKLIDEAKENFQKAYEKSDSMKKNVKKIKDKDQKKQVSNLLNVMNDRKELLDSFFDNYLGQLKQLNDFYDHFASNEYDDHDLDHQVEEINEHNEDMEDMMKRFNQITKQYSEMADDYYKMVVSE